MTILNATERGNYHVSFRQDEILDVNEGFDYVKSPKCGAVNIFSGCIRDTDLKISGSGTQMSLLNAMYYEAYNAMAYRQVPEIIEQVLNRSENGGTDANSRCFVAIRLGLVPVQETAIIICVSSTHRSIAFDSTMSIIDKIKKSVPIWKKMIFSDSKEQWLQHG